jgi:hypothetical protein
MKRTLLFAILLGISVILAACSTDRTVAPDPNQDLQALNREQAAAEILHLAGWQGDDEAVLDPDKTLGIVQAFDSVEVAEGIFHYRWEIQMSTEPMDVIALHRVVKMGRHDQPIRTKKAVFLQHGDAKDFVGMFLPGTLSETTPDDFGAAVYWARRNVDVWGIDQAWNLVPAETTEFGFMADWGIDKQYRDLGDAVAIARLTRRSLGNGYGKMILLGYSSGSGTGYALINAETQLPPGQRQVGGWISADYSPVTDNDEWNQIQNCDYVPEYQTMIANGEYGFFVGFDFLGMLARDDPDGPSPALPGFTNLQAALYFGAGPIFGVGDIHYLAGIWEDDLPVDLVHLTVDQWLDFMIAGAPWEPVQFMLDYSLWGCPDYEVPWDDHFGEITVPVLNIAPAGGIGPYTQYCLGLLGSNDITDMVIQTLPDDQALFDIGHIDIWVADVAPDLVWAPVLDWIEDHTKGLGPEGRDIHVN